MSVCTKTKVLTDFFLNNRSFQLDHTNLKYNPAVKAVRAIHDWFADALHNGELRHRYDVIKSSIKNPVLVSTETYRKKMTEGKLPSIKKSNPRQDLYKRIQKMENEIFLSDEWFNANEMSLLQYEQRDEGIRNLFYDDIEFHQYMSARYDLYKTVSATGAPLSKYFLLTKSSEKDFANTLLKDIESNEVLAVLTTYKNLNVKTFEQLQYQLAEDIYKEVPDVQKSVGKKKEVDALAKDMIFQVKIETPYVRLLETVHNETRSLVIPLKYTAGMESGQRLLVQNAILWSVQLYSRSAGMSEITNSDLLRLLQDDAWILKSEIRVEPNVEYGEWIFDRLWAMIANVTKGNKVASVSSTALARIAQWGWHNAWDMIADPWAKNVCIAEAMAEMGITGANLKMYEEQYRKGVMMPNLIDEIRVRAHDKYAAFFTNSKTASRTTNRFSLTSAKGWFSSTLYLATNFMQWYAMKRASQIVSAVTDLKNAIQLWKVSDMQSFKRWLDGPEWGEIRNILLNSLYAAKLAVYIETNQAENEYLTDTERLEKIKQFALWLNDFINAAGSSLPWKMIWNAITYWTSEYVTTDSNWISKTEYGWIPIAVVGFLKEALDSMYREFPIFDLVPALINAWAHWNLAEMAAVGNQMIGRVINGIWRFSLTPWTDIYGMAVVPDVMDDPLEWLMVKNESNQSMVVANKMRTIQDISAFVDAPGSYTYDYLLKKFVPLNTANLFSAKPDAISKEASYAIYKDLIRTDPIANNFYNGIFDDKVLYTKEEAIAIGKPEYANVDSIYKSLTAFNNLEKSNDLILQLQSEYGISDGTFDAMMQQLIQKVWPQTYQAMIINNNKSEKDRQTAMLQAIVEAKIPWAGRVLLGYIADQEYKQTEKKLYPMGATTWEKEELRKAIISEYGNQLLLTDKYAQVSLLTQRANQLHPNFLKANDDLTRIVNSSILTDMLIHQWAKNWDVNARYLGSVLSISGKYMPDSIRLPIIEKTFYEIDKMNVPENIKTVLKTGVWLWNIDFIGNIAKDPVAGKKYKSMINNVLNLIYNNQEKSTTQPNPIALDTGEYSKKTGRSYGAGWYGWFKKSNWFSNDSAGDKGEESKSTQDNFEATQMLAQKIVWLTPFKRNKVIDLSNHNTDSYKNSPKNQLEAFYVKVLESQKQVAQSQKLDNSADISKLSQQHKPNSAKIGYKSKKWKTTTLSLPKAKKAKPVTYKW